VALYYESAAASGISSSADTRVAHFSSVTSKWENMGGSGASPITSTVNFTSFSPITFGSVVVPGSNPLPIELLSFTGHKVNNSVQLDWETASELNNDFFTIEKSLDGVSFTTVANVDSKAPNGNSTGNLSYTDYDNSPAIGINYYRLKQTDLNGTSEYSEIIAVEFDRSKDITFTVFPNPNEGEFTVDFSELENNYDVTVELVDMQGKLVYSNTFLTAEMNGKQLLIHPKDKVAAGLYNCNLKIEGVVYTARVVVH
ncbi:MAG: T9SS type A sorting domain-containing protein, partial [Bacteroidia bacterium]|nr:T9SS type A sorting domain-containing protein [Bacteroidia bacterium]